MADLLAEVAIIPQIMPVTQAEVHTGARGFVVRICEGQCPWCGWGIMRAEAGQRGFCPSCAGPVLAVLR